MEGNCIVAALQHPHNNVRVTCGFRWLVWTGAETGWWEVYERTSRDSASRIVVQTDDLAEAVRVLTAE